jgi:hypothetical protein
MRCVTLTAHVRHTHAYQYCYTCGAIIQAQEELEEEYLPPKISSSKRSSKRKRTSLDDAYKSSEDDSFSSGDEPFSPGTAPPKKLSAAQRKLVIREVCCHQHLRCSLSQ